ncbi:MAG: DNA topoisomerase subunit B [Bacillota bacterium]|nr:DNA topoisomerase subunit B [Bacillota bacterium]
MTKGYTSNDIQVLEGLEAVRMRPGMYVGTTAQRGLHHILWEIVDNAVDEASNGFASEITITLHSDGSVTVEDNGRGIPVGPHPQLGVSGVEVVFTRLHAGGKFNNSSYAYSGGLHGVGAAVVNALSKWLVAEVSVGGKLYKQEFRTGTDSSGKFRIGEPVAPLAQIGNARGTSSRITFMPDDTVFEDISFSSELISRRLRELAFLTRGVKMTLVDERALLGNAHKKMEFSADGGITDFAAYLNKDKTPLHDNPIHLEGQKDGIIVDIALQYNDSYTEGIFSYVNNIPTTEGGTHETGFKAAITKVMNDYARKSGLLKEKDQNLAGEDCREGMTAIISLKMHDIQFEGQTKTRLGNTEARLAVETIVTEQMAKFMEDLRNANVSAMIMQKAMQAAKVREAARKAKSVARQRNKLDSAPLVGKLAACTGRNARENEIFIVEGDSAGGSAKQGRDRRFQAILPLRGKPLNVEKKRLDQVLSNEEFRTIIAALGTGIDEDFDIKGLRYDKVIILSDADQDGAHIRAILLTFFFRYMRELIAKGHIYIGQPPLYRITKASRQEYAYTDKELEQKTKGIKGYSVQRYKGLGEMNPEQLWETTMNPVNRALVSVAIEDAAEAEHMVTILMGDKVEPRKEYISEHANFNRVDRFAKMGVK